MHRCFSCAVLLASLGACAHQASTVQLGNGRVGHVIANCRDTASCDTRSAAKCGGSPYGIHEKTTELREEVQAGANQVMGVSATKIVTYYKYVIECNPGATMETRAVGAGDPFTRAENEVFQSFMKAQATSDAIVRRSRINEVCSLRPGSNRAEELALAKEDLGNFTCPSR